MANEQEKNVTFVQLIESHACLYASSNSYATQDIKEKAWNDIFNKKKHMILVGSGAALAEKKK